MAYSHPNPIRESPAKSKPWVPKAPPKPVVEIGFKKVMIGQTFDGWWHRYPQKVGFSCKVKGPKIKQYVQGGAPSRSL